MTDHAAVPGPAETVSIAVRGWPGMRSAAWSIIPLLMLGPGAITVGFIGKVSINGFSLSGTDLLSTTARILGRSLAIVVGGVITLMALAVLRRWVARGTVTLMPDRLDYTTVLLGWRTRQSVAYAIIAKAMPFLEVGSSEGYVLVTLQEGEPGMPVHISTGSYAAAERVADSINARIHSVVIGTPA